MPDIGIQVCTLVVSEATKETFIFEPSVNLLYRKVHSVPFQFDYLYFAVKLQN